VVVSGLFMTLATEAKAQYVTTYLAPLPPGYVYVYPTQPTYVQSYRTVVPQYTRPPNPTGYQNRPYYGAYGYGFSSNGSTDGFPPFRGRRYR
jgi:hypothetical protein